MCCWSIKNNKLIKLFLLLITIIISHNHHFTFNIYIYIYIYIYTIYYIYIYTVYICIWRVARWWEMQSIWFGLLCLCSVFFKGIFFCHVICTTCHMFFVCGPNWGDYLFLFKVDFTLHWCYAWWRPVGRNVAINKFIWSSYFQCADFFLIFSFSHFDGNSNNLLMAIKVKLMNLHTWWNAHFRTFQMALRGVRIWTLHFVLMQLASNVW